MTDIVPKDARSPLRACLLCSLIKVSNSRTPNALIHTIQSQDQFKRNGCDNCERMLQMRGSNRRVNECTSTLFDGHVDMFMDIY